MKEADFVRKTVKKLNKDSDAFFYRNHGGMYGLAGLADITGCYFGTFYAIEMKILQLPKRPSTEIDLTASLSPLQKKFLIQVEEGAGGKSFVGIRTEPMRDEWFFPIQHFLIHGSIYTLSELNDMRDIFNESINLKNIFTW